MKKHIEKWTIEYNYSMDIIRIALKKTTSKANPNFDYLDKFLTIGMIENFEQLIKSKNF